MNLPLRPLTIYCLDERVKTLAFAKQIVKPNGGDPRILDLGRKINAIVYIPDAISRPPPWQSLFQGLIPDDDYKGLTNCTTRALLLIEAEGHVFAITFGHAKHLFNYEYVRRGFGLRVVINCVPERKLHRIDMRQFEKLSMQTSRISSKEEPLQSFGLDWTQDILRAVTGVPENPEFANRISGADALILSARYNLDDIPILCRMALDFCALDRYKNTGFSYIDWFQPEVDRDTISELDMALSNELIHGSLSEPPSLASDEIIDLGCAGRVRFDSANKSFVADLDIDKIRNWIRQKTDDPSVCLKLLRQGKVESSDENGEIEQTGVSLYEVLTWDQELDEQAYMLLAGVWIRISHEYAERVRDRVKNIPQPTIPLRSPCPDSNEDHYIDFACEDDPTLLSLQGLRDKAGKMNHEIEPCDIVSTEKILYCIKSGNKSKSLNHLFRQGVGAVETLLNNVGYFQACSVLAGEAAVRSNKEDFIDDYRSIFAGDRFSTKDYEICFCIIKPPSKRWPTCIPYLAQITLNEAVVRLEKAGIRVSIQHIESPKTVGKKKPAKSQDPRNSFIKKT